jgi:DNA modification methylase
MVKVKLIQGHVLDALKQIPDNSVDCIITSPPYWYLRKFPDLADVVWDGDPNCEHEFELETQKDPMDRGETGIHDAPKDKEGLKHGKKWEMKPFKSGFCKKCGAWYGQLGLEPTLELYLQHLLQITAELKRILKPTGVMFWNHGDNYIGSLQSYGVKDPNYKPTEFQDPRVHEQYVSHYQKLPLANYKKLPAKCMALQNYRLILKMIDEQGWILRNIICWYKPNHLPSSVKDRFTNAYEPIFMFVKSKKYFFNLDLVREPCKTLENHSFNIRVREARKGHFEKMGVRASEEEMQKYDNQGRLIEKYDESLGTIKSNSESELTIGGIGRFFVWQKDKGRISSILGKNPSDMWKFLDEKSLIWLAGILDSEGSIYATKHDRRDDTTRHYKNVSYEGYVEIVNTDSRLIEIVSKIISEILNKEVAINIRDLENKGYRNVYRITLFGEDAFKLCEILLPYLITKKERAKLLIELQKTKEIRKPFSETPEEIIKKREEIYEKIRFYNQYGEDLNFCPDFWTINTEPFPDAHFATFPTELVRRCIKAGCPEDGVVLDPFVGSGTTIKVAIEERRNVIGIDIVPEYINMTIRRCNLKNNPLIDFELVRL